MTTPAAFTPAFAAWPATSSIEAAAAFASAAISSRRAISPTLTVVRHFRLNNQSNRRATSEAELPHKADPLTLYVYTYICMIMHVDVFQTLADPTRRRIVEALLSGEQAVNDIVAVVDIDQSGVSRHLGILSKAGFVQVRPDG